jgi:hypothetical protein
MKLAARGRASNLGLLSDNQRECGTIDFRVKKWQAIIRRHDQTNRTVMSVLAIVGTVLNFIAAILLAVPFFLVYEKGALKFKSRKQIEEEAASRYGSNEYLANDLLFTRHCALGALPLLVIGTSLLIFA